MAETVKVVFSHHWTDRRDPANVVDVLPGGTADVEPDLARTLVNGRVGTYASVEDAEAAGAPVAPFSSVTKDELIALADANGVDASGTKAEIAARLVSAGVEAPAPA